MRSVLATSALACLVLATAVAAATHESVVRHYRGATRNPSATLTATVYPKNIVQGSETQSDTCHPRVQKATCCKTPEQTCCNKPCFQTPEYKPEVADSVAPEVKEKDCKAHDATRCCSTTVQSCCQSCPRFAESKAATSAEYQGRLVSPVIDCPGARRSRSCCATDTEHLSSCCTPRKECQQQQLTRIGDMKMGSLKACPEEERSRCCERVSDACCKPCGSQRRRVVVDADLAPLHSLEDGCPAVRVRRCCTASSQRCCSQCQSPVMTNLLEYQTETAPAPKKDGAAAATSAAKVAAAAAKVRFAEYAAAVATAAEAPKRVANVASLSRFAEYEGETKQLAAKVEAPKHAEYQGGSAVGGAARSARLSGAGPLSAISRKPAVPANQKRAYQNSLTPAEFETDEEYADS